MFYESQALTDLEAGYASALIRVRRWPQKQCYANAQQIVLSASGTWPMLDAPACPKGIDLLYVDGWATQKDRPNLDVEHAWFTINGKVVDVTWREGRRRVLGRFSGTYYGQPFSPVAVKKVNMDRGRFGRISIFRSPLR